MIMARRDGREQGAGRTWAIVLAGGDGERVGSMTVDGAGVKVPKQFWNAGEGESLLHLAVRRAARLLPPERILTVVAAEHERWWKSQLRSLPRENVIVQPQNRGTAAGILLPFVQILRRDPDPQVIVLPSDHYVEDEEALAASIRHAAEIAVRSDQRAVLLGMVPEEMNEGYGWILVSHRHPDGRSWNVGGFIEKPEHQVARTLASQGGLINSMILAAGKRAMGLLFARTAPDLVMRFLGWHLTADGTQSGLRSLYQTLPVCDFSRDVLQSCDDLLLVLPVDGVGWVDLGTPRRLGRFLDGMQTTSVCAAPGADPSRGAEGEGALRQEPTCASPAGTSPSAGFPQA